MRKISSILLLVLFLFLAACSSSSTLPNTSEESDEESYEDDSNNEDTGEDEEDNEESSDEDPPYEESPDEVPSDGSDNDNEPTTPPDPYQYSLVVNGKFDNGTEGWESNFFAGAAGTSTTTTGEFCFTIQSKGSNDWNIQLIQPLALEANKAYYFKFDAYANQPVRLSASIEKNYDDYLPINQQKGTFDLTNSKTTYITTVKAVTAEPKARVRLSTGGEAVSATPTNLCIDNVYLDELSQDEEIPETPQPEYSPQASYQFTKETN